MCEIQAEDLHLNPQAVKQDFKLQIAWVSLKATTALSPQTEAAARVQIFKMPQTPH